MKHSPKRVLLFAGLAASLGSCLGVIAPRIIAWNEASQGALIASFRAVNCRVLTSTLRPNIIPMDGQTGKPLPPGSHVCDWQGMTGQINGSGAVDFLKQGQSETIVQTLKSRGFKP